MSASHQLSLDALLEHNRVAAAFTEAAIDAIARSGNLIEPPVVAEDSASWVGQLLWELDRMNREAAENTKRLKRLTARLLHVNIEQLDEELGIREAEKKFDETPLPRPTTRALPPPRTRIKAAATIEKAAKVFDSSAETSAPTKRLTDRQRELVSLVEVTSNIARYTPTERIPDWPALKVVMLALGAKWVSRQGFKFPDDVDGAEMVRVALEKGEIIDWDGAGFFPTPEKLADSLVAMFNELPASPMFLEPSAGTGNLIAAVKRRFPDANFYACELIEKNRVALEKMGIDVINEDFLKIAPGFRCDEPIDAVVMNPPFAKRADIKHITHAIDFLKPGGQLAAIASAGVKYRDDKFAQDFRDLIARHGGCIEDNGEGAFAESGTMVRTVRIWLEKN